MQDVRCKRLITATSPASISRATSRDSIRRCARPLPFPPPQTGEVQGAGSLSSNGRVAGVVTKEMIYIAERENLGRQQMLERGAGGARRRRELRRLRAGLHYAGVRARGSGARARDHPGQHQSCRTRADDHRPQLPHQDQCQYRQLGSDLVGRGRGREDGVGDPLGRRHRHGSLHRAQHPQHARMDHPQRAGADRHRADLSGAGEGQRRSGQARLGVLQGHADRAVRAGRRLFHHPCRRAAWLHPSHRQPGHRHRLARRLDHGEVVPVAAQGELPLRALRRDLRHHAQV